METVDLENSLVAGALGVFHLKRLWSRCIRDRAGVSNGEPSSDEWALDNVIYHGLNLSIEETIQFVYQHNPSFKEFESWILEKNGGELNKISAENINSTIARLVTGERSTNGDRPARILDDDQL